MSGALLDRPFSNECRAEWTRLLAQPKQEQITNVVPLLILRLGNEWLALETDVLQEITEQLPIHKVPGLGASRFLGLVNIQGELLLCFSAHAILGIAPRKREAVAAARLIVIFRNEQRFVIAVDEVLGIRPIPRADFRDPPATLTAADQAVTRHVFTHHHRVVGLLDADLFCRVMNREMPAGHAQPAERIHG